MVLGWTDPDRRSVLAFACICALAACSPGDRETAEAAAAAGPYASAVPVEVHDAMGASMGRVAFPVSCSESASGEMRLGLALLHNMTYTEAASAFESAAAEDPSCALARWGMAMTYLHPLWPDVPTTAQLARGWELLQEARAVGLETPREEAYVGALEAYYEDGASRSEPERLASYAEAWQEVRLSYPDDPEAALFAALSRIATAPASDEPMSVLQSAGATAEGVLAAIPDHPGAHHYIIHAYDAPPLAERALSAARSYGRVAPENSHALHMTSHIFTRRGLWDESIEYNRRAADVAAMHPIDGAVSYDHLHALDYLAYANLQQGRYDEAEAVLAHLGELKAPVADHAASAYAFAAVPARIPLERHDWARAATVRPRWPDYMRWDAYPHLEALPVFANALGAAHLGDRAAAERSIARLAELATAAAALPGAYDWGTQVRIQELGARAWLAYAEGDTEEAVRLMTEAATVEAGTTKSPVTPGEVLPAGELLGDMLLDLGRYDEALEAYDGALARTPNRMNSLRGAAEAAEKGGDAAAAAEYRRQLEAVTTTSM